MHKKRTRLLSLLLTLCLLLAMLPVTAAAAGTMTLTIGTVSGAPGSTVKVKLDITDNPGLASLKVKVAYDDTILVLQTVEFNAEMGGQSQQPQTMNSPVTLNWFNGTENFSGGQFNFATLTFLIREDAPENAVASITATYNADDVYNIAEENINMAVVDGCVGVLSSIPGDINGDKSVNNKDLTRLFQYLADWDVPVNEAVLDTNGDGSVNNKDLTRLFQYLADWDVVLYPIVAQCDHTMEAAAYKAATCTENGNIAYWHCTKCGKYYSSETGTGEISKDSTVLEALGHDPVTIPAVPATTTSVGYTEGTKCARCELVLVAPVEIPMIVENTRNITYNIANGDSYIASQNIQNPNPSTISTEESLTLKNLSVPGYMFLGWYDLPSGSNAEIVKKVEPGESDIELYAHWEKIEYTVQFRSNLYPIDSITYTVDKGAVLPTPKLSNYIFAGWCDDAGNMYGKTTIPIGTTGNMTLTANWTSERNKAVTKTVLDDPVIYEDEENNIIYFAYEIGKIENVPLYEIKNFGYISGDGVTKTETMTYTVTTEESIVETYAKAVSEATTESSDWTLSNGWSQGTTVDEEWCRENGYTEEEATTRGQSESGTWNVSSSSGGSTQTTDFDTTEHNWKNEIKIDNSRVTSEERKIAAGVESSVSAGSLGIKAEVSASVDVENNQSEVNTNNFAIGDMDSGTTISTDTTITDSSWNTSSSYGGSKTSSMSETTSRALTEMISQKTGYGQSYIQNEDWSNSQGFTSSTSSSEEYSTTVTYSKIVGEEHTSTWTTQATKPGYHRWIVVGDAHVFAIVGYDMAQKSYFVSTLSIMGDETREFEDYSYNSGTFSDNENGVISFEIPYEVAEYVADKTAASSGLKVDQKSGVITGYTGTDNCVVIPEYLNVGNGDVVKVTGISSTAFAGNKNIVAVVLSDFITEIPANAFAGCTALQGLMGGSVTKIGAGAFSGCTSIVDSGVTSKVTELGNGAFEGVAKLQVNPANAAVLEAAVNSGAKSIVVYLQVLEGGAESLSGKTLTIPEGTEYFELNGYGETFEDLTVDSGADKTVINKANFTSTGTVPLKISSPEVVLNQTTIQSPGISVILSAEETNLGLQSTISTGTLMCRNINLYESNDSVVGKLSVLGTMYLCGEIGGSEHLNCSDIRVIDYDTFYNMMHSYTLYFDANGGTCIEASRDVPNGTPIGALPNPTRDNFQFNGWYTEPEGGTKVTEDTIFSTAASLTIYAQWLPNTYTVTWNTEPGYNVSVTRETSPYGGASLGNLSSGDTIYYGDVLQIAYVENTGYSIAETGITSATVTGTLTADDIYADVSVNSYTASWEDGTGYIITVTRASSPCQGAPTGVLDSGETVYYGDVLEISYAAETGYTLGETGETAVTVTGDVTAEEIYASATANSYTYTIKYVSSNGTNLGSSSATHVFGTTNTISAPGKSGYKTPSAQTVAWDATSKTITFVYSPSSVSNSTKSGRISNKPIITYSATVQYQNRTANSVQLRVKWTGEIETAGWTTYGQNFTASVGSVSTGTVRVVDFREWNTAGTARSSTGTSGWITVPLNTTNATSVKMSIYYFQTNSNDTDMTKYYGEDGLSTTWTISIPAY